MTIEKKEESFKPMQIGFERKQHEAALLAWNEYADSANWLLCEMVNFLETESMDPEQFLELIRLEPKEIILRLYELTGKIPAGIVLEKAVEIGLVSNESSALVESNISSFFKAKKEAERIYKYSLESLKDDEGLFVVNDEFKTNLEKHFSTYTKSEKENEILVCMQQIIESVNKLADFGLTKPQSGINGLNIILNEIKVNKYELTYELNPGLFRGFIWDSRLKN